MKQKRHLCLVFLFAAVSLASCGIQGPQGEKGEAGTDGLNGTDGEDGSSLLTGNGLPADDLGKEGDSYIDLDTFEYYVKREGSWVDSGNIKGGDGERGTDGNNGSNGKSAYETYIENYPGYTWGEKQWISDLALGRLSVHVGFETNGGGDLEDKVYCKGDTAFSSDFPVPSKDGFAFDKWCFDSDLSIEASVSFLVVESITLYASYKETEHTKGDLLSVPVTSIEGVSSAGLFACKYCREAYYDTISYSDIGVPVINLDGDFTGISKNSEVKIAVKYDGGETAFGCDATAKIQGDTSAGYPKKNYTIKLYKSGSDYSKKDKIELFKGYGKQSKYTLKANYVDYSEARNVVSADIWGDVVRSRKTTTELTSLTNGGAVDGYPVLVFQNGVYQGLYTLNLPKDESIFGMEDETVRQAVISTNTWSDSVALKEHIASDWTNGWEIEYCSTEDDENLGTSWVATSFNEFIDFLNGHDGEELKEGLPEYVDIEAAIDTLIYTTFIFGYDNTAKNILWATYDGKKWAPSVYDLDGTWGACYNGIIGYSAADTWFPYSSNNLWNKIWANYKDEVIARYKELREGALSLANIDAKFSSFFDSIPDMLYDSESAKWTEVNSQEESHETQIISWASNRARTMDSYFEVTVDEKCYIGTFSVDNGGSILIYKTQDYSLKPDQSPLTVARDSETGLLDATGEGQISFEVVVPDGYKVDSVAINGSYKNLKGPEDLDKENVYRITKIKSDLAIDVRLVAIED